MRKLTMTFIGALSLLSASAWAVPAELLGLTYDLNGITFQVANGAFCTDKHKDIYAVRVAETFPLQLTLDQTSSEPCEVFAPLGVTITYTYKELGLHANDEVVVTNPVRPGVISVLR